MDIVLGVSMEPSAVRMVLIEGTNADGATVEEESIGVAAPEGGDIGDAATDRVIAALVGTREGAIEGGYELSSTGVTWTDPTEVAALRLELAARDVGSVMLVSPLLAAAALAQNVGAALDYEYIAMLFVEDGSATLAVVEIADGSIVDLHRQSLRDQSLAAGLVTMVAGLDAPGSRADGVFLVGCGVNIVDVKPALEAATSLVVSCPEEPEMALARGAALASANAPLFASSTSALAYALDPGTGEVNPRALTPSYLDVCAMAGVSEGALAYSAVEEEPDPEPETETRRRSLALVSAAVVGVAAVVAGLMIVSLGSHVRTTAAQQSGPRDSAATPAIQAPATELPAQVLLPTPSAAPPPTVAPAPSAAPPPVAVAAAPPPPVVRQPPPQTVTRPAQAPAYLAPAPRRQPTRQAAPPVQPPVQEAPQPSAPPPAAPAPAAPAPAAPTPVMTMYLHLPFVSIPIPINPPPPPPPPAEPGP